MADKATERNGRGRQMTQVFAPRKLPGTATGEATEICVILSKAKDLGTFENA